MSRTYKDRPSKVQFPEFYDERRYTKWAGSYFCEVPGWKSKKKRNLDTEWHWMTTPMWWIREFMQVPQRREGRDWERNVVKSKVEDLEDIDPPNFGRKPHKYFW